MKEKKLQTNFTMTENLRIEFLEYCENNGLNKSRILEILIRDFLKSKSIDNDKK